LVAIYRHEAAWLGAVIRYTATGGASLGDVPEGRILADMWAMILSSWCAAARSSSLPPAPITADRSLEIGHRRHRAMPVAPRPLQSRTGEAIGAPAFNPVSCWRVETRYGKAFVQDKIEQADRRKPARLDPGAESLIAGHPGADGCLDLSRSREP
jgi:hypothetical protein